jgi:hypothetical protein
MEGKSIDFTAIRILGSAPNHKVKKHSASVLRYPEQKFSAATRENNSITKRKQRGGWAFAPDEEAALVRCVGTAWVAYSMYSTIQYTYVTVLRSCHPIKGWTMQEKLVSFLLFLLFSFPILPLSF